MAQSADPELINFLLISNFPIGRAMASGLYPLWPQCDTVAEIPECLGSKTVH